MKQWKRLVIKSTRNDGVGRSSDGVNEQRSVGKDFQEVY